MELRARTLPHSRRAAWLAALVALVDQHGQVQRQRQARRRRARRGRRRPHELRRDARRCHPGYWTGCYSMEIGYARIATAVRSPPRAGSGRLSLRRRLRFAPAMPPDGSTPELRASDADREAACERLRVAALEGRLDPAELDERMSAAYAARLCSQLRELTADVTLPPRRRRNRPAGRSSSGLLPARTGSRSPRSSSACCGCGGSARSWPSSSATSR